MILICHSRLLNAFASEQKTRRLCFIIQSFIWIWCSYNVWLWDGFLFYESFFKCISTINRWLITISSMDFSKLLLLFFAYKIKLSQVILNNTKPVTLGIQSGIERGLISLLQLSEGDRHLSWHVSPQNDCIFLIFISTY